MAGSVSSNALSFLQIHPYRHDLSELILSTVHARLKRYGKPVFIGECGLDARPPGDGPATSPAAEYGLRHAIWASAVSGAMNGRMLWWEDGYDLFYNLDLRTKYRHASRPVAQFLKNVDRAGLGPLESSGGGAVRGGVVGSERAALGWFRDSQCSWPEWPVRPMEKQSVEVALPAGAAGRWKVGFYDTANGEATTAIECPVESGRLRVPLPSFQGSVAFTAVAIK